MEPLDTRTKEAFSLLVAALPDEERPRFRPQVRLIDLVAASKGRFEAKELLDLYHPFISRGDDPEELLAFIVSTKFNGYDGWFVAVEDRAALERRLRLEPFRAPQRARPQPLAE